MTNQQTNIRFERNALVSAAHLTSEDGGTAFVFCSIPGGRPQFQFTSKDQRALPCANAPRCESHREFVAFVTERFGGES